MKDRRVEKPEHSNQVLCIHGGPVLAHVAVGKVVVDVSNRLLLPLSFPLSLSPLRDRGKNRRRIGWKGNFT